MDNNRSSCLASCHAWRRQAAILRQHAVGDRLALDSRHALRREAEAADRQAEWWLQGAIEVGLTRVEYDPSYHPAEIQP